MKRNLLLVALFLVLGTAAVYLIFFRKDPKSSTVSWDMEFAVPDAGRIAKIFLADRTGKTITLEKKGDAWYCNDRYTARPTAVQTLLETLSRQTVWYIPPKSSEETMIKSLATEGIKVELYDARGEKMKSFYVGGVTNDERGTFMMMDGAEQPYVVHVPSFIGQLRVRYMMKEEDWRDRTVFSEKPEEIAAISVEYPQIKSESFKLEKTGRAEYTVKPFFSTTPVSKSAQRKGVSEAYILQFEKKGAEGLETYYPQRDSVTALVPFAIVTLTREDGSEKQVRFWPLSIDERPDTGEKLVTRYFAETSDNDFFLVQDVVFGPIFRGYRYFFEGSGKPANLLPQ